MLVVDVTTLDTDVLLSHFQDSGFTLDNDTSGEITIPMTIEFQHFARHGTEMISSALASSGSWVIQTDYVHLYIS